MKIQKKTKERLSRILYHAERTQSFIDQKTVHVCRESSGTTTEEYKHVKKDSFIMSINKEYGSDLVGLLDVIQGLKSLIEE